ncbi:MULTISPECIES: GDSL-type esterase/lipase family protein [unclassified Sphingobium]|uniref:GDSL-type esterase/lipase family protein n=1 Tax=unclassified Sphingobium TaxID=2611147 RepID=UPI0035A6B518
MPTANIASARSIAIKAARWRAGALLLAGALLAAAAPAQPPNADPAFPFSNEIEAFAGANNSGAMVREGVLFLGSSSIRLWDIAGSFRDRTTINRGFGGATTAHVLHYYKRLLPPASPRSVIVYVGENDLAAGTPPDAVSRNVLALLKRLRADYPRAPIAFLSLKPSPIRWTLRPKMAAVNDAVAAKAKDMDVTYLDVGSSLLAPDGLPDASLFRPDGLHMNARGYDRWTRLVDAWLGRAGQKAS